MENFTQIVELRQRLQSWRAAGERIALVPTMGSLHRGHGVLAQEAAKIAGRIVVSIFVNPLQFGPKEDFAQYPRTPDDDRRLLQALNVDAVFMPEVAEIYPLGQAATTRVEVPALDGILCGEFRPGHFTGVATVVTKLLNVVQPDVALFGEKDFQQLAIIRRASADLCMPYEIRGVPTVRETDGLALSSRNRYLDDAQRALAPRLHQTLQKVRRELLAGNTDYAKLEADGSEELRAAGLVPDYLSIRNALTLQPATTLDGDRVVLAAVRLGKARLIDNLKIDKP